MSGLTTISKEAGVLRILLQRGSINLKALDQFLGKVESYSPPSPKKKSIDRFNEQLQNLDGRRARKIRTKC
jgi:hypothetical protein